jgi:hypothetical protein
MPGKAKRKGKHPQSKKSKAILRHVAVAPPAAAAGTTPATPATQAPTVARPATPPKAAAAPSRAGTASYPYFIPELKRIGILAAIIIVVLVILSIVLS